MTRMQKYKQRLHDLQVDVSDEDLENILEEIDGYLQPDDIFPDTMLEIWASDVGMRWPRDEEC